MVASKLYGVDATIIIFVLVLCCIGFSSTSRAACSKNCLSDRSFNVRCSATKSDLLDSSVGVPQGFVPGPLLFSLYTGDLERIVMKYKLGFYQYADDT